MTQIISAARRTGKSQYIKDIQKDSIIIAPSRAYIAHARYDNALSAEEVLDNVTREGRFLGYPDKFTFIFEEPGMYDHQFFELLKRIPKEQIRLIIGTPYGKMNLFDWFLQINKKHVTIWSHAVVPQDFLVHEVCDAQAKGTFL